MYGTPMFMLMRPIYIRDKIWDFVRISCQNQLVFVRYRKIFLSFTLISLSFSILHKP